MRNIKWMMFDADNTLLDFNKASKDALWKAFEDFDSVCTEEIYAIYKKINIKIWMEFEDGQLSASELRPKRFAQLFDALGQQIAPPADFSITYLENLVKVSEMYDGIDELLSQLKKQYKISLITNGLKEVQRRRLQHLKLENHFDSIIVSDEIGVAKPDVRFFEYAYQTIPHSIEKEDVLVVGDNIIADVGGGNAFGFKTCWIHHGKENQTDIKPDYSIKTIEEFSGLLS